MMKKPVKRICVSSGRLYYKAFLYECFSKTCRSNPTPNWFTKTRNQNREKPLPISGQQKVTYREKDIEVTAKEFDILVLLAQANGSIVTREK